MSSSDRRIVEEEAEVLQNIGSSVWMASGRHPTRDRKGQLFTGDKGKGQAAGEGGEGRDELEEFAPTSSAGKGSTSQNSGKPRDPVGGSGPELLHFEHGKEDLDKLKELFKGMPGMIRFSCALKIGEIVRWKDIKEAFKDMDEPRLLNLIQKMQRADQKEGVEITKKIARECQEAREYEQGVAL
jgi:hypothetical protein